MKSQYHASHEQDQNTVLELCKNSMYILYKTLWKLIAITPRVLLLTSLPVTKWFFLGIWSEEDEKNLAVQTKDQMFHGNELIFIINT